MDLKVYDLSVDEKYKEEAEKQGKKLGWNKTAFTATPAIKVKGLMFNLELQDAFFMDDEKMRLAAPLIIPMENFRKGEVVDGKKEPDYKTRFTPEFIEDVHGQLMSDPDKMKNFFNLSHTEEEVPAFIREIWIVEEPETDKSFTIYGVKVPKGTLFAIAQITDKDYWEKMKAEDISGFSIEGFFGFDLKMNDQTQQYGDVILLNDKNEALFLKRTDNDEMEAGKYSLAGGKIEENEAPEEGAKRELKEETGIEVENVEELEAIENEDGSISHYFVAKTNSEPTLSEEHTDFKWLDLSGIETEDLIFGQNDRFKQLYQKAINLLKIEKMDIKLPDGEHEIAGKIYVVKDGVVIEEKEKATEEEMSDEEKEKAKEEELQDETEEGTQEVKTLTREEIQALIQEEVKPLIDEAMKVVIDEVVGKQETENETKTETKEEKYNDQEKKMQGVAGVFQFVAKKG